VQFDVDTIRLVQAVSVVRNGLVQNDGNLHVAIDELGIDPQHRRPTTDRRLDRRGQSRLRFAAGCSITMCHDAGDDADQQAEHDRQADQWTTRCRNWHGILRNFGIIALIAGAHGNPGLIFPSSITKS